MGRIAELLDPRHRGVYADAVRPERRPRPEAWIAGRPQRRDRGDVCEHRVGMGTVEEVRIAKRTGFCYGVREAIDKAKESAAAGKATHTLGQVVHNEGVIQHLLDFGVRSVETLDDVDHGAAVVIRAHGVKPEVFERAEQRGLEVIDGTCTWVIAGAAPAPAARRGGVHDRPPRHPEAPRGRRPARASRPTRSSSTRRRTGSTSRAASGWR